jgi:hypothetical protein
MRKFMLGYLPGSLLLVVPVMFLIGCGGGGDGTDLGTTPSPTKSVVITGTVPGTVAIAYDYATGLEAARDVASGTPKTFTLSLAPGAYYLMFIESEGTPAQRTYAFRNVTGGNVITCKANTTLDLGVLVFNVYPGTAVPQVDPISGNENVTATFLPEAIFSPGDGKWTATRTFVSSSCSGHAPGTTVTENVTIGQGFGLVTYMRDGTNETAGGVANVNTAILTGSYGALETIYLTMQADGSLAGSFSKVGYGGACSEEGTISAVRGTSPPPAATLTGLSINGPSSISEYGTATYTATASWSDGSASTVTPTWSVSPQVAEISPGGVLSCQGGVSSDQTVTITATYSAGGITETASMVVTITPFPLPPAAAGALFAAKDFHGVILARVDGSMITIHRVQADPYCHAVYSATGNVVSDGTFTLDFNLDLGSGTGGYSATGRIMASGDSVTVSMGGAPPVMLYMTSSGMAGSYQGTYSSYGGGPSGVFAIGIDGNGNVVGFDGNDSVGWFFFYATLNGNIFSASAIGGPVFSGSVSGDTVKGTWTNPADGRSGTFGGARMF